MTFEKVLRTHWHWRQELYRFDHFILRAYCFEERYVRSTLFGS
jgi:hypothetical protein